MEKGLVPTLKLSLEMTDVLARTEQVGLKINMDTLDEIIAFVREETRTRREILATTTLRHLGRVAGTGAATRFRARIHRRTG